MTDREKQLLDYLYMTGEQIRDYMRRNGFSEHDTNSVSVDVRIDKDGDRYDSITAWHFTADGAEPLKGVKREFDIVSQKSYYGEVKS